LGLEAESKAEARKKVWKKMAKDSFAEAGGKEGGREKGGKESHDLCLGGVIEKGKGPKGKGFGGTTPAEL